MNSRVLIVDDKKNTLKVVGAILEDEGYTVFRAGSAGEARKIFLERGDIDAVLADLKMPGGNGIELFREIKAIENNIPFVIMTAHGTIESAVQAMKEGVTNYLLKPLNYEELSVVLRRAIRERETSRELAELRQEVSEKYSFQNIIGTDQKMRDIFEMLRAVAPTDASILIQGETGTGKELLARAIHSLSRRRHRDMVCINSAALAESLLEAELFGYTRGAFTGAVSSRKGRFESADGGTLFLDEIGQTSLKFQSKLLRFLQEGTFEPVGSVETRSADVRVITASNRDLMEEMGEGRFLSDLYYRIEVISITLPPLRERRDDIPLLVDHFTRRYAGQYGKRIEGIDPQAVEALLHHGWPGNVRELENCVARAVILCKGETIVTEDLPEKIRGPRGPCSGEEEGFISRIPEHGLRIRDMERELILKTLKKCRGNKSLAAGFLGISRKALYEKMERYDIGL